jgi:FtsP/CotA-like multicopper oxidase with cupredoxin domain
MDNKQLTALSRRRFLSYLGIGAGVVAGAIALDAGRLPTLADTLAASTGRVRSYTFDPAPARIALGKQTVSTWAYNGVLPGPEIRVNVGDTIRAMVRNHLSTDTTMHWHGLPIPNAMDGIPYVTQAPIKAGQTFLYDFVVPVSGTYWYHSHVGLQLDRGLYGPLIVEDPRETKNYDQDVVLVLDDWLDGVPGGPGTPDAEYQKLVVAGKSMAGKGMGGMSGSMNMSKPGSMTGDVNDVIYPYYLVNGKTSDNPYEITVKKGQRIRLRFINAGASTIFRLALNGHKMTVTHTDGQAVEPVEVDTLRIGMGERYDVLVTVNNPGVWQLAAQVDGTNYLARALVRYQGSTTTAPAATFLPPELKQKQLTYAMLKVAPGIPTPPSGQPAQVAVALSGSMAPYVWKMNNQIYPDASKIAVQKNHLVQFQFNNQTMMPHPMHLHGHFFQLDNGTGRGPMKDTVLVDPMQKMNVTWFSNNPGQWAFHCHNDYHMKAGMFRVVSV